MKKLSETYKELGIEFTFPILIKDSNGYATYYENSDEFWYKREYDSNGNVTYYEDSYKSWQKWERDASGNETYYEDSNGKKRGTPRSAKSTKTCEGKVVEVDGIKYKLKTL